VTRPPSHPPVPDPLAPEVAALLAAERRAPPPSAARQALILSRVQAAAAATGAATAAGIAATAATANAAPAAASAGIALAGVALSKPLLILAATTTAVAAIGGGVAISYRQSKVTPSSGAVTAAATASPAPAARRPSATAHPGGSSVAASPHVVPVPMPVPVPPPRVSGTAAQNTKAGARALTVVPPAWPDIEGEAAILEQARLALAAGDATAALAGVGQHALRFPRGSLAEEREALGIRALLLAGQRSRAERRADAFARQYPGSVQGDSIDRALREIH